MPSIIPNYRSYDKETTRLLALSSTLNQIPLTHQKLIAEIALLRLCSLFENLVSSIPTKLLSGATFLDGSTPTLLTGPCRSTLGAKTLMRNHKRTKPQNLKWSKAMYINSSVKHVLNSSDNFLTVVNRHASFIGELQKVRNRIAHNNSNSRTNYQKVVRQYYGEYLNNITPGILLLTPRFQPLLLDQYLKKARILAKDLVKA